MLLFIVHLVLVQISSTYMQLFNQRDGQLDDQYVHTNNMVGCMLNTYTHKPKFVKPAV